MADEVRQIERAVVATGRLVAGVTDGQWANGTPCAEWDARAVLNHTVGGMRIFAAELDGTDPGAEHESDWLGTDPAGAYATAAALDLAAWRRPGALDTVVHISLGALPGPLAAMVHLTEVCVHGVDLAVATGQRELVDEELCEELLSTMRGMAGFDAFRVPGVFGAAVPPPPGAAPHGLLLAYLGRSVS
ncbi:TIGR03086 family metal-binding protein [Streptomyces sp. NPDC002928]|uniref:TIGR03086 family metal-binding protein n=1 Tax=Streptomyces sp. NPDC002928 TaxID=3154440 RepID=UPI0033B6A37D